LRGLRYLSENESSNKAEKKENLRVVQVCPRYHPYIGGVETHVKEISERLVRKSIEIEVVTTDPKGALPEYQIINNVAVKRFKSWAPNEAYYVSRQLSNYLKKRSCECDIIHAHSYHAFPALYAALNKGDSKLIFTPHYHGRGHTFFRSLLFQLYRYLGRRIFKESDRVIAVSEYERDLIQRDFNIDDDKLEIIPNGINKEEFKDLASRQKENKTILSVGRLEKYKGFHHLIRVLPELEDDVNLEIVGKGPYMNNLLDLIRQNNLGDRVTLLHDLDRGELLQRYVDADLVALLSRDESYGLCVAEALAAGTPCVVAETSALTEWVDNKNCYGVGVPINYPELKTVIEETIGKKVEKIRLWDWDDVSEQLVKIYRGL